MRALSGRGRSYDNTSQHRDFLHNTYILGGVSLLCYFLGWILMHKKDLVKRITKLIVAVEEGYESHPYAFRVAYAYKLRLIRSQIRKVKWYSEIEAMFRKEHERFKKIDSVMSNYDNWMRDMMSAEQLAVMRVKTEHENLLEKDGEDGRIEI